MGKIKDLSGKVTESGIEIIEFAEIKNRAAHWKCKCHCGNKQESVEFCCDECDYLICCAEDFPSTP